MRYLLAGCGNARDKRVQCPESPALNFGSDLVRWDGDPDCNPDVLHDMEVFPYPFADEEFDEIHAYECLEHCGTQGDAKFFFGQFAEFYRILKPGGVMALSVPMWNHYIAFSVPDHKRVLPAEIFGFLDQDYYLNVGRPGYGDYRKLLGKTDFKPLGKQEVPSMGSVFVVMRKA